ncbi:hypothetical protein LTR53_012293 [Teratosphaeriaceae sp. CCFEE 6253]|nr:hypothetical protein LTR53_012293 [Teratosphaeriaceae sp. CCFEE 6253]
MDMAANSDTGSFDLHRLPRELRDHIHDFILVGQPETTVTKDWMHRVCFKYAMTDRLGLVSRQFKQECKEREARLRVLVLEGDLGWMQQDLGALPALDNLAVGLQLHIQVNPEEHDNMCPAGEDCEIWRRVMFCRKDIQDVIARLSHGRCVALHLYIGRSFRQDNSLRCLLEHRAQFANLGGLSSLDVYHSPPRYGVSCISPQSELVASWDPETKQLERTAGQVQGPETSISRRLRGICFIEDCRV